MEAKQVERSLYTRHAHSTYDLLMNWGDAGLQGSRVLIPALGMGHCDSGRFGGGRVNEIIIEMEYAFLFVTGVSDGSCLAVVADAECDVGLVGYEMAVLVDKTGPFLTPELRAELQGALPR